MKPAPPLLLVVVALGLSLPAGATPLLSSAPGPGDFPLVVSGHASPFLIETTANPAVSRAADDLRADVLTVTGVKPPIEHNLPPGAPPTLIVGVVGQSALLDRLSASGKIDLTPLRGAWETYLIEVVPQPFHGCNQALVVAGSDRRGAIYGLYELSSAIGVSPWHWWDDLPPQKRPSLSIAAGAHRFGPPSVKYRGIFLNDEDWGLRPWASHTFDPATGNIGPKTYAKVFELLLRLKANTLWPAMHPGTKPFNAFPEDKVLADNYGIVMGSSHAEPMLRDNVGEWTAPPGNFNYVTHRSEVLRYWEQRVAENARYDNIYTLGMRGIHDSAMQGPKTTADRIRVLEQVFADQRALLAKYVNPNLDAVPQMFCAYKEVLDLYRQGLRVPGDVTIVWPDDNYGYIRDFASPAERTRPGGFGVYYHLSYLGSPMAYLWLCSTPPALVWEEMSRAYEHGADRIWIVNVGDLKPAEIPLQFFLELAWNVHRWGNDAQPAYLHAWAARNFGPASAPAIADILMDYYLLNFQRKPEQLQWWLPHHPRRPSTLTDPEVQARLDAYRSLARRVGALRARLPSRLQNAFFELVAYPVLGSALANERFFEGERGNLPAAEAANRHLADLTRTYNERIAGGKWNRIMALEPADGQWSSMRIARWAPPPQPRAPVPPPAPGTYLAADACRFSANLPRDGIAWTAVPGLGRSGDAMTILPTTAPEVPLATAQATAPRLDYPLAFPRSGTFALEAYLLPTHPNSGSNLRLAVALDDGPPRLLSVQEPDGGPVWASGVLDEVRIASLPLTVPTPGPHTLHVYGIAPGVVLDKLVVDLGGLTPSYLGPATQ